MLQEVIFYHNYLNTLNVSTDISSACKNPHLAERKKNLRQALDRYQRILQIYTRDILPLQWACAHANLGYVYGEIGSLSNEPSDMLAQALDHYQQALQVLTEENTPAQWAIVQQGLVLIAIMRQDGPKVDHLQQAITLGQSQLTCVDTYDLSPRMGASACLPG